MAKPILLVIDDEQLILDTLGFAFPASEAEVRAESTAAGGIQSFRECRPTAVLLDVRLPDKEGYDVLRELHDIDPKVPIILMTGHGTAQTAIEAMRVGAYDYLVKPLDLDVLTEVVHRAFDDWRMMSIPAVLAAAEDTEESSDVLIGRCPGMQDVYKAIGRVAPLDLTVLILGESGTGKELIARAIYHYSKRSKGKFLAINCASIPEQLLESELFGHERGAFTGAERRRIGKFEQCNGGTLFLDEIGDMPPLTQAKILRVLQDGQFERVGGSETVTSDVRIIAATNRKLEDMLTTGQFREDLYYRLSDFVIHLPALRDRGSDLDLLAAHFVGRASRKFAREVTALSKEAIELLHDYTWPGNVRELQSVLRQAIVQTTGPILGPSAVASLLRLNRSGGPASVLLENNWKDLVDFVEERLKADSTRLHAEVFERVERQVLVMVMKHCGHNLSQAARILGISRPTLRSKLSALGISSPEDA